jgi:hypothetical protein
VLRNKTWPYGIILLVAVAFGCDVPERPKVVTISKAPTFRPSSPKEVQTVEQALTAIITVCRDDLALPEIDPLYVLLYKNTASFAFYGFGWRTLSFDVDNLVASAAGNTIHVNLKKTAERPWGTLLAVLAHEYGHNVHYRVTGDKLRGTAWFTEGFGDWVATRVLDALGWQSYSLTLHRAKREISRHRNLGLGLYSLRSSQDWKAALQKPQGYIRTYSLALVAVDRVIKEKGLTGALKYLKSGDFGSTFGVSYNDIEAEFEKALLESEPPRNSNFSISKPQWKLGAQWTYEEVGPGKKTTVFKQVTKEDFYHGIPGFVVKVDNEEVFYTKETLGLVATVKDGKVSTNRDRPNEFFAWPLEAAKQWKNNYTLEDLDRKETGVIDRLMVAPNMEEVRVPAGTFQAVKIEAYDNKSGRLDAEYWYSPTAKWFVKSINYGMADGFVREQRLVSFKID